MLMDVNNNMCCMNTPGLMAEKRTANEAGEGAEPVMTTLKSGTGETGKGCGGVAGREGKIDILPCIRSVGTGSCSRWFWATPQQPECVLCVSTCWVATTPGCVYEAPSAHHQN